MRRAGWAVLVVGAVVLGACGDRGAEGSGRAALGADAPAVFGAGTPIADGFVVPTGSVALTQPITPEAPRGPTSWAVELVPDDPVEAMNDLMAQASELGFELGGFTSTPCVYDDEAVDSGTSSQQPWPPPDQPVPRSIECSVSGHRVRDGDADHLWMTTGRRFIASLGEAPGTSGSISIEQLPNDVLGTHDGAHDYEPTRITPLPATFPAADVPADPTDLGAGESLLPEAEAALWEIWEPRLVEGSRLVVPTRAPICQGGFASVLDITGDPDTVMAGYVEQIRAWSSEYGGPPTTSELRLFDRRVVRASATVDGTSLSATMVVGLEGEPTRMNYFTCSG